MIQLFLKGCVFVSEFCEFAVSFLEVCVGDLRVRNDVQVFLRDPVLVGHVVLAHVELAISERVHRMASQNSALSRPA